MTFYSNKKQKSYVLNPRGKPLYDDTNRFGTKMLEKMGWSKGKGLGAKLDGEQNFIRVSHKVDTKGVGFDERDDQWTQHEDDFSSLLKSLDNTREQSEKERSADSDGEAPNCRGFGFAEKPKEKRKKPITSTLSGKSLEEMSKNSRSRVHYKKFTRGKDISRYSEKDLANIFGKKSIDDECEATQSIHEETVVEVPINYGITTIETGKTIGEYFKSKQSERNGEDSAETNVTADLDEKKKRKKKKPEANIEEQDEVALQEPVKKKNKKRKLEDNMENGDVDDPNEENEVPVTKAKKAKSTKSEKVDGETVNSADIEAEDGTKSTSMKKKSKKRSQIEENANEETIESSEVTTTANPLISNMLSSLTFASSLAGTSKVGGQEIGQLTTEWQKFAHETYELNRFQAELFRFVDLDAFKDSNVSEIRGYGYGDNIELKITAKTQDQSRIKDLWDTALISKYGQDAVRVKKKKMYGLKKKNVFRAI